MAKIRLAGSRCDRSEGWHSGLFGRIAPPGWGCFTFYKIAEQPNGIAPDGPDDGDKFDDVQPPFATFIFGNKGLWLP